MATGAASSQFELDQLQERIAELEAENQQLRSETDAQLRLRVAELKALQQVNNAANSSIQLEAMLEVVTDTIAEVTGADVCSIYLFEDSQLVLRATHGLNQEAIGRVSVRLGEGITGWTAQMGQPIALRDAWQDPRFRYNRELREEGYSSMLSVPIIRFQNEATLVGVINLQHRQPRDISPDEVDFLRTVAGQITFAIENSRLYEKTDQALQARIEELMSLRRVSNVIAQTLDPQKMLAVIVREARALSRSDAAAIFQLSPNGACLRLIADHGFAEDAGPVPDLAIGDGLIGRSVGRGVTAWTGDLSRRETAEADRYWATAGFRALCCLPLLSRSHKLGGLVLFSRQSRTYTNDDVVLLQTFADETAIAIENARLYEEARRNLEIKSALLAEMHHRVKNNLQTVAALLSLQARHAKSPEVSGPLRESVVRIRSLAAVHDLLSREEIGITSFGALVKQIVDVAAAALIRPSTSIEFRTSGEETPFASREATTIALILTELINNALLHGLAGAAAGTITIAARRDGGRATLTVHDSGRGLPADFDPTSHGRLGLQIVQTLAQTDLVGMFHLRNESGCFAEVNFPSPPPHQPAP